MTDRLRLAALISGGGRTLLNLADRIEDGSLPAEIALVIASRSDLAGVERARARGFEVRVADPREHGSPDALDDVVNGWLTGAGLDLVCLCGYLRLIRLDPPLAGRVLNIHPALLPDFGGPGMYGDRVHAAVLAARRRFSGCTVHFVDDVYDHGPVLLQRVCRVAPDDDVRTLAARVFAEECIAYPAALRLIAGGRVKLENGRALISP